VSFVSFRSHRARRLYKFTAYEPKSFDVRDGGADESSLGV